MFGSAAHKTLIYFRLGLHTVCEVKSLIFPFSTLGILLDSLERLKEGKNLIITCYLIWEEAVA